MVNALIGPITSSAPPHHLDFFRRRRYESFAPVRSRSYAAISAELTMASASALVSGSARVAVAQMTSINDLAANFATCSRLVKEAASAGAKLLCFPESFSYVGFKDGESLSIAQPLDGPIMRQYQSLARESKIWLSLGGFQETGSDSTHLCNTHVVIDDAGIIRSTYKKIHLFDVDVPGGRSYKESTFTESGISNSPMDGIFTRVLLDTALHSFHIFL